MRSLWPLALLAAVATLVSANGPEHGLAAGDRLVIEDPDGRISHVYEGRGPAAGPGFWTRSVRAEEVVGRLTLISCAGHFPTNEHCRTDGQEGTAGTGSPGPRPTDQSTCPPANDN